MILQNPLVLNGTGQELDGSASISEDQRVILYTQTPPTQTFVNFRNVDLQPGQLKYDVFFRNTVISTLPIYFGWRYNGSASFFVLQSIASVGESCFENATFTTPILNLSSVNVLSNRSFYNAQGIQTLVFPNNLSIPDSCFEKFSCKVSRVAHLLGSEPIQPVAIGQNAFASPTNYSPITSLVVGAGNVGSNAFYDYYNTTLIKTRQLFTGVDTYSLGATDFQTSKTLDFVFPENTILFRRTLRSRYLCFSLLIPRLAPGISNVYNEAFCPSYLMGLGPIVDYIGFASNLASPYYVTDEPYSQGTWPLVSSDVALPLDDSLYTFTFMVSGGMTATFVSKTTSSGPLPNTIAISTTYRISNATVFDHSARVRVDVTVGAVKNEGVFSASPTMLYYEFVLESRMINGFQPEAPIGYDNVRMEIQNQIPNAPVFPEESYTLTIARGATFSDANLLNDINSFTYVEFLDMTTLPSNVFGNSPSIKRVFIGKPTGSPAIASNAFVGCPNLERISIASTAGSIPGAPWGAPPTCVIDWLGT